MAVGQGWVSPLRLNFDASRDFVAAQHPHAHVAVGVACPRWGLDKLGAVLCVGGDESRLLRAALVVLEGESELLIATRT